MFRRICQVAVPVGRQSDNYGGCFSLTECPPGGVKSTIYGCLVSLEWLGSRDPFNFFGGAIIFEMGNL